ncbi:MAG TPA: sigma-54 dependent transcriptional regulator [Syntrophales bacterium]|nr:sigma-54 dependent transcriptional regulator [Syntrophales bacterium]
MTKIMVVDDEEMIRFAFEQFLSDEGYEPLLASDADTAIAKIRSQTPQIVFLDYRLPGTDGLELLKIIRDIDPSIAVVFMTAFGAMDVAIKAMQLNAYDYLTKPLDLEKVRVLIHRILEGKKSIKGLKPGEGGPDTQVSKDQIMGKGVAMQEVFKMIGLLTMQDVTVLITGESGVGKELVARAIHANSPRSQKPFVALNCGAVPDTLLEAEMFGYEKGAFTGADAQKPGKFEVANGGVIFLDEIGELKPSLQVKLLRVLQEKTFERLGGNVSIPTDARILAATNKDLEDQVEAGNFRKDLFFRLHLVHLHLPPLRDRMDDISPLVDHFIKKANLEMGRNVRGITREALTRLQGYNWPGNVRELENQIRRAMVLSREDVLPEYLFDMKSDQLSVKDRMPEEQLSKITGQFFTEALKMSNQPGKVFDQAVSIVEQTLIREAIKRTQGNQMQAADILGIHRSTLRKKIRDYKIEHP